MKIGVIGYFSETELVDCVDFNSSISLLDYELVLIDFNTIITEYSPQSTFKGLPSLSEYQSAKMIDDCGRRKKEILELLRIGRTVVAFTPQPTLCYADTGKREYSGTGRNRQTTRILEKLDLTCIFPFAVKTEMATGESIECIGDGAYSDYWSKVREYTNYTAFFEEVIGEPILRISLTEKVVGTIVKHGEGNILFLPKFFDNDDIDVESQCINSVYDLCNSIQLSPDDYTLPDWAELYRLPFEEQVHSELDNLKNELLKLKADIEIKQNEINKIIESKILFTGTGRILELKVKDAFESLGFSVTEGLPGRDDLILEKNGEIAVVEVKGVKKSAAEKHAAQLEKWISEYYSNYSVMPKGILVVNAYKDIPLNQRPNQLFPPQMLRYSEQREHCLITGLQLLKLQLLGISNEDLQAEIIDSIFKTKGVYSKQFAGIDEIIKEIKSQ